MVTQLTEILNTNANAEPAEPRRRHHHHRERMHQNDVKMVIIVVLGVLVTCGVMVLANRMGKAGFDATPAADPSTLPTDLVR